MPVAAKIKFVQGLSTPPAGEALIGVLTTPVTCSNDNNADVLTFEWEVIDSPPGSALTPGIKAFGAVPTFQFVPDLRGSYHIHLRVTGLGGDVAEDFRVFAVPEPTGHVIPPFDAVAAALNFSGQLRGWAKYVEEILRYLLGGNVASPTITGTVTFVGDDFFVYSVPGKVQTTVAGTAVVASFDIPDECSVTADFIVGMKAVGATAKAGRWDGKVTYQRNGGAPAIVGAAQYGTPQFTTVGDDVLWNLSGNTLEVQATAADGDDRNWSAELRVQVTLDDA